MITHLSNLLNESQINADMRATDRWEAIDELIGNLVHVSKIKPEHRESVANAVRKRESSMSTGIGFGIAIPHATTGLISEPVAALGRSKQTIDFDALDGQPVNLVVQFLVPQGQFQTHLHTLAGIAKLLQSANFRRGLEEAPDAAAILGVIKDNEQLKKTSLRI